MDCLSSSSTLPLLFFSASSSSSKSSSSFLYFNSYYYPSYSFYPSPLPLLYFLIFHLFSFFFLFLFYFLSSSSLSSFRAHSFSISSSYFLTSSSFSHITFPVLLSPASPPFLLLPLLFLSCYCFSLLLRFPPPAFSTLFFDLLSPSSSANARKSCN